MGETDKHSIESGDLVGSLIKGLKVIQSFGVDAPRMTLTEVAERTDMTRASARRFLLTLVCLGLARSDGRYFSLTPRVLCLGYSYLSSLSFWEVSQGYLDEVTKETNESCSVAVLDGSDVVYVARSASQMRIISAAIHVGTRLPAHATSMGQVFLAYVANEDLEEFLNSYPLTNFTKNTLDSREKLTARLEFVREKGYAIADQELELGLRSIAVPVFDQRGKIVAAINIASHVERVPKNKLIQEYLPVLQRKANSIAASLI